MSTGYPTSADNLTIDLGASGQPAGKGRLVAAIFDLDGTLLDSMQLWDDLAARMLQDLGIAPDPDLLSRVRHMSMEEASEAIRDRYQLDRPVRWMSSRFAAGMVEHYAQHLALKPGAAEFVERLSSLGVRCAVATANDRRLSETALARLGLLDRFAFVLTCAEVGVGKDQPDVFLEASRRLGVEPSETLVVEDTWVAARTAARAGFRVAAVAEATAAADQEAIRGVAEFWLPEFRTWPFDGVIFPRSPGSERHDPHSGVPANPDDGEAQKEDPHSGVPANPDDGEAQTRDPYLIQAAAEARLAAYSPYSGFRVGAALIDDRGRLHRGCNVENASYGATCCAERTAVFRAIADGARRVRRIAVVSDREEPCLPCGICRQVLAEFAAPDFLLLAATPSGAGRPYTINELLPDAFQLDPDRLDRNGDK